MPLLTLLLVLTLVASVSPLLTAAHLWQLKEWRWDRLKEHLRAEGSWNQLAGRTRGILFATYVILLVTGLCMLPFFSHDYEISFAIGGVMMLLMYGLLVALALLSVLQIALHKQPLPVWTKKAVLIAALALLLMALTIVGILLFNLYSEPVVSKLMGIAALLSLPILAVMQWIFVLLAWALLHPIDTFLKHRIMRRAQHLRSQFPDLTVIGITGSVGKTTTKELIAHVLRDLHPLVTPGHVNSEMGVAQWMIKQLVTRPPSSSGGGVGGGGGGGVLVVEMGAYRRGEIANLCSIVQPQYGVLTFIGAQHLALFGSEQALCAAKAELLEALPEQGRAFVNGDSDLCRGVINKARCPVTIVGTGGPSDLEAFDIEETPEGIRFTVQSVAFAVPIHGTHNVTNVLLAIAVGLELKMPLSKIAERLRSFAPPKQTFEIRTEGSVTILDDTHNASPMSFRAAIEWARTQPSEKKILLTSGLIELGEDQERIHMDLGALAAPVFQQVIFTHAKRAQEFERGFGKPVKVLGTQTINIPEGSLLVCVGLVSASMIQRLLPVKGSESLVEDAGPRVEDAGPRVEDAGPRVEDPLS